MINNDPPLIIFDGDRARYYAALERYDTDEDLESMYAFLMRQKEKTGKRRWTDKDKNTNKMMYALRANDVCPSGK